MAITYIKKTGQEVKVKVTAEASGAVNQTIHLATDLVLSTELVQRVYSFNTLVGGTGYSTGKNIPTTGGTGTGFTVNITGTAAGGISTFTKSGISNGALTQTGIAPYTTSGYGSGATFNITESGGGYTVSVNAAGSNYAAGDTVFFQGVQLNGNTGQHDLTLTISTVTTGAITSLIVNNPGSSYTIGDVITITTGGANATITVTGFFEGLPTVNIIEISATGASGSSAVITRNSVDCFHLSPELHPLIDWLRDMPDIVNNTSDILVTINDTAEIVLCLRKVSGYASMIQPELFGSHDNPNQVIS